MKHLISLAAMTMTLGALAPVAALADDVAPPPAATTSDTAIAPGMRFKLIDADGHVLGELVSVRPLSGRPDADRGKPQQRVQPAELKKSEPRTNEEWRAFWNSVLGPSTP